MKSVSGLTCPLNMTLLGNEDERCLIFYVSYVMQRRAHELKINPRINTFMFYHVIFFKSLASIQFSH